MAKYLSLCILICLTLNVISLPISANPSSQNSSVVRQEGKAKDSKPADDKYLGYSVDGRASASILAAQRSHTVAGKDERNFAVFTGIVVVVIVYIFLQFAFKNR